MEVKGHQVKLIKASGRFARIPGNASNSINYDDAILNPIGNGFWAAHKTLGEVLVIVMGPNKGMWAKLF